MTSQAPRRRITAARAFAVVAALLIAGGLTAATLQRIVFVRIAAVTAPDTQRRGRAVDVTVVAPPYTEVTIASDGATVDTRTVLPSAAGCPDPCVTFRDVPLRPGAAVLRATGSLWHGAWVQAARDTLVVRGAPAGRPVPHASNPAAAHAAPAARAARSLRLAIRLQQIDAGIEVALARSDPAAIRLVRGEWSLSRFVDAIYGVDVYGRTPLRLGALFARATPHAAARGDAIVVTAASGPQHVSYEVLPPRDGTVSLQAGAPSRRWARDDLRVRVDDFAASSGGGAVRTGDGAFAWQHAFDRGSAVPRLHVRYRPFASLASAERGARLSAFAFVPDFVARYLAYVRGLVVGIPMLAYLVLTGGAARGTARVARALLCVAVAPEVFLSCFASQPEVNAEVLAALNLAGLCRSHGAACASVIELLLAPVATGAFVVLAACVVRAAAAAIPMAAPRVTLAEIARAVGAAAAAYAAVATIGGLVVGSSVLFRDRSPAAVVAASTLAIVAAEVALLHHCGWFAAARARAPALRAAVVAAACVLALPVGIGEYVRWTQLPLASGTPFASASAFVPLFAAFVREAAVLSPFAFGLVLWDAVRRGALRATGLSATAFVRLAMCCFAVDPSGIVVVVPVSFALAWSTFAWIARVPTRAASASAGERRTAGDAGAPARAGEVVALTFAVAAAAIFAPVELDRLQHVHTPFVLMDVAAFGAGALATFLLPASAFAAGHASFAGAGVFGKAFAIAAWAIACSAPAWFLRFDSVSAGIASALIVCAFWFALAAASRSAVLGHDACGTTIA